MYTIYTKDNCPQCVQAKSLLDSKGIPYASYKIGEDIELSDFKARYPEVRSVPFILNGEEVIGGLMELRKSV